MKRKIFLTFLMIVITILNINVFVNCEENYINSEYGFSVDSPENWKINEEIIPYGKIIMMDDSIGSSICIKVEDSYEREKVNLDYSTREEFSRECDFAKIPNEKLINFCLYGAISSARKIYPDYREIDSGIRYISNLKFVCLKYSATVKALNKTENIIFTTYITVVNGYAFTIVGGYPTNILDEKKESIERYMLTFNFFNKEEDKKPMIKNRYTRYFNKEKGFSINIPKDWERLENYMGTSIIARVSSKNINEDIVDMSISVSVTENIPRSVELEYFCKTCLDDWLDKNQNYNKNDVIINKYNSILASFVSKVGNNVYLYEAYFLLNGNRGYVIVCNILKEKFEQYEEINKEIVNSFQFE